MSALKVMNAMMRIRPPHSGQIGGNTSWMRAIGAAHGYSVRVKATAPRGRRGHTRPLRCAAASAMRYVLHEGKLRDRCRRRPPESRVHSRRNVPAQNRGQRCRTPGIYETPSPRKQVACSDHLGRRTGRRWKLQPGLEVLGHRALQQGTLGMAGVVEVGFGGA